MSRRILQRRSFLVYSLALIASLALVSLGLAGKPPGGGGGGGGVEGGTIYFFKGLYPVQTNPPTIDIDPGVYAMDSTGGNKNHLPVMSDDADPSRLLHGGHRWFVVNQRIEGEMETPRFEIFAIRDDGDESSTVQLTDDPDLQFLGRPRWAPGETEDSAWIACLARRWNADGTVDPNSVGVYVLEVFFDFDGNVAISTEPKFEVSLGIFPGAGGEWHPDVYVYWFDWSPVLAEDWSPDLAEDWSPDLAEIVYSNDDRTQLRSVIVATGQWEVLATGGSPTHPVWSPAGNLIAFESYEGPYGAGNISTIRADGADRKVIVKADGKAGYYYPSWSPSGGYLTYYRGPHGASWMSDIYRATASGRSKTNLTADILGPVWPMAWR